MTDKSRADELYNRLAKLEHALTTIVRSGAPGASILGQRQDGHACQWCRGMAIPCPVEIARLALEACGATTEQEDTHEPGELIVESSCPCCGASLRVEYGDDEGEIGILGVACGGASTDGGDDG